MVKPASQKTMSLSPIASVATDSAINVMKRFDQRSALSGRNVKKVRANELLIQSVIGRGSFSSVFKIHVESLSRDRLGETFALKCLRPDRLKSEENLVYGVRDLVLEADFLSRLDHENVIGLRGVSRECASQSCLKYEMGFFLVLELLEETLEERLTSWKKNSVPLPSTKKSLLSIRVTGNSRRANTAMYERMNEVAAGVSRGMEYIHAQDIILRDLKPGNVGIDANGTVKLFDFGLARDIHTLKKSSIAGTARYMAPETITGQGSRLASDVYSFGLLLWQICTLNQPFHELLRNCTRAQYIKKIADEHHRPSLRAIQCRSTQKLIQKCWDRDPAIRPSFSQVSRSLTAICDDTSEGRKSKFSEGKSWFKSSRSRQNFVKEIDSSLSRGSLRSRFQRGNSATTLSSSLSSTF